MKVDFSESVNEQHLNIDQNFYDQMSLSESKCWFLNNGTVCLNTNIYSYLETSSGTSYILYLNIVHVFNTSVNQTSVAA